MKRFLTKYGIIALAIATLVAVTMGLLTFFSSSTGLFTNLVNSVAAPFRSASASVSQWVDDKARYRSAFDAMKEYDWKYTLRQHNLRVHDDDTISTRFLTRTLRCLTGCSATAPSWKRCMSPPP